VPDYYNTLESRIGYQVFLGGTRHFGYYARGTWWPFPIDRALRTMEEYLYQTIGLEGDALLLDAGAGICDVAIYMAKKGLRVKQLICSKCMLTGVNKTLGSARWETV